MAIARVTEITASSKKSLRRCCREGGRAGEQDAEERPGRLGSGHEGQSRQGEDRGVPRQHEGDVRPRRLILNRQHGRHEDRLPCCDLSRSRRERRTAACASVTNEYNDALAMRPGFRLQCDRSTAGAGTLSDARPPVGQGGVFVMSRPIPTVAAPERWCCPRLPWVSSSPSPRPAPSSRHPLPRRGPSLPHPRLRLRVPPRHLPPRAHPPAGRRAAEAARARRRQLRRRQSRPLCRRDT